jgi:hypothetical protein
MQFLRACGVPKKKVLVSFAIISLCMFVVIKALVMIHNTLTHDSPRTVQFYVIARIDNVSSGKIDDQYHPCVRAKDAKATNYGVGPFFRLNLGTVNPGPDNKITIELFSDDHCNDLIAEREGVTFPVPSDNTNQYTPTCWLTMQNPDPNTDVAQIFPQLSNCNYPPYSPQW